jgi:hypothetical protein
MNRRLIFVILILLLILIPLITLFVLVDRSGPEDEWGWLEKYSSDQEFFTALEAANLIKPLMTDWNRDSYISSFSGGYLWTDDPLYDVQADGRIRFWHFIVCSPSSGKWVSIEVVGGEVGLGVSDKPWGYLDKDWQPVPLEKIIDSNEALRIAMDRTGGVKPRNIHIAKPSQYSDSDVLISWVLYFVLPEGGSINIELDAFSGDVLEIVRYFDGDEIKLSNDWYR